MSDVPIPKPRSSLNYEEIPTQKEAIALTMEDPRTETTTPKVSRRIKTPKWKSWDGYRVLIHISSILKSWILRLALISFVIGTVIIASGVTCSVIADYCPLHVGIWVGVLVWIHAIIGIVAGLKDMVKWNIAHLASSVLTMVEAVILAVLSILNWQSVGSRDWYSNHTKTSCLNLSHDPKRFSELYQYGYQPIHDYAGCFVDLKWGLSTNFLNGTFAFPLFFLALASFVLCCRKVYQSSF